MGSGGLFPRTEDYARQNKKTRPKVTSTKKKKEPKIKIRGGNFKAEFKKASEIG